VVVVGGGELGGGVLLGGGELLDELLEEDELEEGVGVTGVAVVVAFVTGAAVV
jgi:hypothetical protein